ncbi:MAG: VCBS repeat-containing protein, partial [Bryocella sp.]
MRQLPTLLAIAALSSSAALAQIGFSTQTYTAGQDAARPNQLQSAAFVPGGKPDLLLYGSGYLGAKVIYNDGIGALNGDGKGLNGSKGDLGPAQTGDMNSDGAPDVVACAAGSGPSSSNLEIYLNDGTGKLNLAQTVALPGGCASVNLGDVNKDGEL